MGRTFALSFWIASLSVISLSEAGIPLSLRCSSRPFLSTFSRSSGAPFLSAAPHVTLLPILPAPIPDCDVDEIPDLPEITLKTFVILHKVHSNNNNNIEIIITKERKESTDDQSNESIENDRSDEDEMIDESSINHYDVTNSSEEKAVNELPAGEGKSESEKAANGEELLMEQNDEINHNLVKKGTSTVEYAEENVFSDKESEVNKAEDDSIKDEND